MTTNAKSMLVGSSGMIAIPEFVKNCAKSVRDECHPQLHEPKKPLDVIRDVVRKIIAELGLSEKEENLVPHVCSKLFINQDILLDLEKGNTFLRKIVRRSIKYSNCKYTRYV